MGTVAKKHAFVAGDKILSAQVNENFDDLYNEFNGNIDNDNIDPAAGIVDTKLAQITTAGKVSGTALTGLIPSASQDTVVALVDAATIATDASAGTIFTVTITANRTLGVPSNPVGGMKRIWRITQDAIGLHTLSFNAVFRFSLELTPMPISLDANSISYFGGIYNATDAKWDILGFGSRVQ